MPLRQAGYDGGNVPTRLADRRQRAGAEALAATVVLRRGERVRRLPLADYYTGYMESRLEAGEFVQAIEVPLADAAEVRAYKISKRFDCDISAVCAGFAIALDGDAVATARFAFGGMAATVERAAATEAAVLGRPWSEAVLVAAQQALATDFAPLSDMRASAAYRLQVAQNLLRRLWLETRAEAPLRTSETSVWARGTVAAS